MLLDEADKGLIDVSRSDIIPALEPAGPARIRAP